MINATSALSNEMPHYLLYCSPKIYLKRTQTVWSGGYSSRHLCPRVLAAGGKEGSLQASNQSFRPKQCLFWYPSPDAPDQKGGKLPYLFLNY